jgi:hypothetical protein
MNRIRLSFPACALISGFLAAQGVVGDFLYTTSQNETTASSSGGTVLRHIHPNDIVGMRSCGTFAEKWAPRSCFTTMAGDEDAGDDYWEPGIFGEIDALLASPSSPFGQVSAHTVWYSPRVALSTVISGGPGDGERLRLLREPGDPLALRPDLAGRHDHAGLHDRAQHADDGRGVLLGDACCAARSVSRALCAARPGNSAARASRPRARPPATRPTGPRRAAA